MTEPAPYDPNDTAFVVLALTTYDKQFSALPTSSRSTASESTRHEAFYATMAMLRIYSTISLDTLIERVESEFGGVSDEAFKEVVGMFIRK